MPYVLTGNKWNLPKNGAGETVVTWSFGDYNFGTLATKYSGYPEFDYQIDSQLRDYVRQSFATWDDICGVKFVEVSDSASANIRIGEDYIDGAGGSLGECLTYASGGSTNAVAIRLDTSESYIIQTTFREVVTHEIGHALGLGHSASREDMMYPFNHGQALLSDDDIAGAIRLYGRDDSYMNGIIYGTEKDDPITGTDQADTIFAGAGNDVVSGRGGADLIFGGVGEFFDRLEGGDGDDQIYAGDGNDWAWGGTGNDIIGGGTGSDRIFGNEGNDAAFGGGGAGADTIEGGAGNDVMYAGAGNDVLSGGDGVDTIGCGTGADTVLGDAGNDIIFFGKDDGSKDIFRVNYNMIYGAAEQGNDTIYAFENGIDQIDMTATPIRRFSELTVTSTANGSAKIEFTSFGSGHSITLDGVRVADIDASDFMFA